MEALLRCFEAESLARSIVPRSSDGVAAMLRDLGHAGALGDVLANQAVGVFVGAALPRMMRGREEETDSGSALELNVVVELGAVVSGDRFEVVRVPTHEPQSPSIGVFVGSGSELADQDVTGFAIDECHEAMLIARADDGVDFPVADLRAKLGGEGALADVSFAGEAAAAVVSAVAFAPSLVRATQIRIERSAEHSISPYVSVDRFMADAQ